MSELLFFWVKTEKGLSEKSSNKAVPTKPALMIYDGGILPNSFSLKKAITIGKMKKKSSWLNSGKLHL
jgi:hypothetical protein